MKSVPYFHFRIDRFLYTQKERNHVVAMVLMITEVSWTGVGPPISFPDLRLARSGYY